jgi:DNA processing protein
LLAARRLLLQCRAMSDLPYWLAFNRVPSIGRARVERLERHFGTLEAAWLAEAGEFRAAGLDDKTAQAIIAGRPRIAPDAEMERLERLGVTALTWNDARYPARLKETYDKPPVLYVRGELTEADDWCVAVVGTRKASPYGRQAAEHLVEGLVASGVTIVSGLARGIDTIAHAAALRAGGRTIAVLPCPVDDVYPPQNARLAEQIRGRGALVSEYPLGARIARENFWRRNRIVAGMTLGTVVVEAGEESGALLTAKLALDENREVFAVPGSIFAPHSRGTNALIGRSGAKLVTRAEDILGELNLMMVPQQLEFRQVLPADPTESDLLGLLGAEPKHIDEIGREAGMAIATVSGALAMLELKGLVRQVAPMCYIRAR